MDQNITLMKELETSYKWKSDQSPSSRSLLCSKWIQ